MFQGIPSVNVSFTVRGARFGNTSFSQGLSVLDTPLGEVVVCHPIYDGMFCPVTERDAVLPWDSTDTESSFWVLGPVPGLSSMQSRFVTA